MTPLNFLLLVLFVAGHARAQSPPSPPESPPLAQFATPAAQLQFVPAAAPTATPTFYAATATAPRRITWGQTPVGLSIAWLGWKMENLGQTHVWTIGHAVYVPVAPVAPVVVPGPVSVQAQPMQYLAVAAPAVQYRILAAPAPPKASPQR